MDRHMLNARNIALLAILILLALLPLAVSDYWRYVFTIAFYYSIMASSWNLLAGYTGQFSMGHHTFAMIGAYTSTLLMSRAGAPFWVSIPSALVVAALISFVLGVVCLRVYGIYLALITWAFAEVATSYVRLAYSFTGGDRGLDSPLLFGTMKPLPYYYLFLGLAVISAVLITALMHSRIGYYLKSIREDEIAARSMGVNITRYKILAFIIASTLAGMAGAFYGHSLGLISPMMGNFNEMAMIIIFVVIGGMRTLSGPIAGAITVRILMDLLREYSEIRIVILSAIVIILMRFFSGGMTEMFKRAQKLIRRGSNAPASAYDENKSG
jgi:branched-chain amino acid transport system permease protein